MAPDQVALLTAVAGLLERVGTWPAATLTLTVVIGPWVIALLLARSQERRIEATNAAQERRFAAVQQMYTDNVRLVESWEGTCRSAERREDDLRSLIQLNTQAMTRLSEVVQALRRAN